MTKLIQSNMLLLDRAIKSIEQRCDKSMVRLDWRLVEVRPRHFDAWTHVNALPLIPVHESADDHFRTCYSGHAP
jgi:hypothetical protein